LKSVLGIVVVTQDSPAHSPDHRPVPPHQHLQGRTIPVLDETAEQLAIGRAGVPVEEVRGPQLTQDLVQSPSPFPDGRAWPSLSTIPRGRQVSYAFFLGRDIIADFIWDCSREVAAVGGTPFMCSKDSWNQNHSIRCFRTE
jgi:hypothetical protein